MFTRVKNAFYNVVGGLEPFPAVRDGESSSERPPLKFRYTRPNFLQLTTDDEVQVSADHVIRPIIVPRDITKLPWNSGYAEVINAGKSVRNEDQGATLRGVLYPAVNRNFSKINIPGQSISSTDIVLIQPSSDKIKESKVEEKLNEPMANDGLDNKVSEIKNISSDEPKYATPPSSPAKKVKAMCNETIPWVYFALFDGHAGSGVAVSAANTLHKIIQEKFQDISDLLLVSPEEVPSKMSLHSNTASEKHVTVESLIVGALESSFWEMDKLIAEDKKRYTMTGGCTALVAVFILGKLYIANAGDSRAVVCKGSKVLPMSYDFTPETERNRICKLGLLRPDLLGGEFTHLEFARRPVRKDLGKKILYRDAYMTGWCYKSICIEDLKFPLIYGEGKRSRALATIGVTRGFGDHDLKALNTEIGIKPFLTAEPNVLIFEMLSEDLTDSDVLIMGTDGLWDVTSNEKAAEVIQKSLDHFPANDAQRYKCRYTSAAQDLVMTSRGKLRERNWRTADNKIATIDDISVFVIPLRPYKEEHLQWLASLETVNSKTSEITVETNAS